MKVILHGYYTEYSLAPLESLLTSAGHEVFLLNHSSQSIDLKQFESLILEPCLVITSCHFISDKHHFRRIYPKLPSNIITPMEIFRLKSNNCKMIYIPHDLIEPIKWIEWPTSYVFDAILLPYPSLVPKYVKTKCIVFGWIKELNTSLAQEYDSIFLPSNVSAALNSYGKETFYSRYKDIFNAGIPVKLPEWPGQEQLESYLLQQGVNVIPSKTDSFSLMRGSSNIITNSLSSVAREAALLEKAVYFIPDQWTTEQELLEFISFNPNCHIANSSINWNSLSSSISTESPSKKDCSPQSFLETLQAVLNSNPEILG